MSLSTRFILAAAVVAMLAGCGIGAPPSPAAHPDTAITVSREQNGRFLSFVGPKTQHNPPFLGVADTNYDCLRSLLDTRTGDVASQLYVEDSYAGPRRGWSAAQDEAGKDLRFIAISDNEITCEGGSCAYAEEFAAALPDALLRASTNGLMVTFTAKSGARTMIQIPGAQVVAQLAAVDGAKTGLTAKAAPQPAAQ